MRGYRGARAPSRHAARQPPWALRHYQPISRWCNSFRLEIHDSLCICEPRWSPGSFLIGCCSRLHQAPGRTRIYHSACCLGSRSCWLGNDDGVALVVSATPPPYSSQLQTLQWERAPVPSSALPYPRRGESRVAMDKSALCPLSP